MTQQENDFVDLLIDLENAKKDNNNPQKDEIIYDINQKLYYLLPEVGDKKLIEDAATNTNFGIDINDIILKAKKFAIEKLGSEDSDEFNDVYVKEFRQRCMDQVNYWSELKVCDSKYFQNFKSDIHKALYEDYFEEEMNKGKYKIKELIAPISELYYLIGYGFNDINESRVGSVFLQQAVEYNFTSSKIRYELAESYKQIDHWDQFLHENLYGWAFATTGKEVARYFRNMAFYYSEIEQWQYAYINICISKLYDDNEEKINREIDYIKSHADTEIDEDITQEMIDAYEKDTENPTGARGLVKELLYESATKKLDNNQKKEALYDFVDLYNLTDSDEILKIVKSLMKELKIN